MEYIIRQRVYDSVYWKQECFGLSAEKLVDKAVELKHVRRAGWGGRVGCVCACTEPQAFADEPRSAPLAPLQIGGMYGEPGKPTEFICLILKMLQIQPDKDIVVEFIKNDDFKYLRLLGARQEGGGGLGGAARMHACTPHTHTHRPHAAATHPLTHPHPGAFYMRLVGRGLDVYQYLEPLYNDYRKVKMRTGTGQFVVTHIDEVGVEGGGALHGALSRLPACCPPPRPTTARPSNLTHHPRPRPQLIDDMLRKDRLFSIALPRLPARTMLERTGQLEPRVSVLDEEFDEAALEVRGGLAGGCRTSAQ